MSTNEPASTPSPTGPGPGGAPGMPRPQMQGGPMGRMAAAGMPVEKSKNFKASTKRLVARLRPQRALITLVLALATGSVGLNTFGPKVLGQATTVMFEGLVGPTHTIEFSRVHRILLLTAALYISASVLQWLQGYILTGVVQKTMYELREEVEAKINRLPLSYIDSRQRGDLLSRVTNDIDNVAQSIQQSIAMMLMSLLSLVSVLAMMFWISWLLALVALVTIPLSIRIVKLIAGRSRPKYIEQWRHTGTLNAQVEEVFTGHTLVKAFGRQAEVEQRFDTCNNDLYRASFGAQFISGLIQPVMFFVSNLNFVIIAVIGGLKVSSGSMGLGDVQAFIQYSRQFGMPLTQMASMANVMQSGIASAERVFELLDAPEEPIEAAHTTDAPRRGRVVFDHVAFSYTPERPLIEDLSLVAEPGTTVAIVGPTGAGKTTLVNLLMRFYDIQGGTISVDGRDVTSMQRSELRSQTGMVLQDSWLFGGTIRENIAYGRPQATEADIVAAAKAAYVDRFVHALPLGYDTVIDDEASNLSAGERQLITIARAFLADPVILILDEATSSVDTRTEVLVQRAMAALRADRTAFVIAHRLSTIRDADIILVMENGRIVEQGSHTELLGAGGPYAALLASQHAGAVAEVA